MAQATQITLDNQTFPSFRSKLNESLSALNSLHSGTSRPSTAVQGTIWVDSTNIGSNSLTLKFYDGADDISLATIDTSANTVNWLDSSVSLTSPVAITGNSTAGAEIRLPEDTDNGSNYVGLKASNSIASNITFTLPNADGTADQVLKTDGSGTLSFTDVSAGTDWQSSIKTANFTAVAGEGYWINTSSGAVTMTLPSSASVGDEIEFVDYSRSWGTNNCTVALNSLKFQGGTTNPVYDKNGQAVRIVYSGTTNGWIPTSDEVSDLEGATLYGIEYLVVAGGGSGGSRNSGGGGAGGHLSNFGGTQLNITGGETYTVTVGAGGSQPSTESIGNDGSDSSLSGTGITTITATGGGGGGNGSNAGRDGGSGGGSGCFNTSTSGSGTSGQGNDGGVGFGNQQPYAAGGGGGASANGSNGTSGGGGAGGAGLANSITGSSVTRAGGGGGNAYSNSGAGGSGGGGAAQNTGDGSAGTANTGGGGGGCRSNTDQGGAGGSGVVILRMLTTDYSGTTTGSPTVTTDGSDTILTFNSSGSYTG